MAEINENQNQNPPPKETPKTPDIVDDKHAKRIRDLETKLAESEKSTLGIKGELDELRAIVRKAGETPLPKIAPESAPKNVLEYIENLLFKP